MSFGWYPNAYSYNLRDYFDGRYNADSRWVDILAAKTGWTVLNMGQNGREIPSTAPAFAADTDLLIVMLWTNNLLQDQNPEHAAERLGWLLSSISLERAEILLIAPSLVTLGDWVPNPQFVEDSLAFAQCCQALAKQLDIRFADAGKWNIPLDYDGVYFIAQGHKAFSAGLLEELR